MMMSVETNLTVMSNNNRHPSLKKNVSGN